MCLKEFLKNIADEIRAKKSEALGETVKDDINPQDFSMEIFGISLPYLSEVMVDVHGKGKNFVTSITIEDDLTEIKKYAFASLTNITNITIPSNVTSIGESAFKGCTSLATVNISTDSNLSAIGASAFEDCKGLKSFYIPDGVTEMLKRKCFGTSSLTLSCLLSVNH